MQVEQIDEVRLRKRAYQKKWKAKNKAAVKAAWAKWAQGPKGKASAKRRHQKWYDSEKGKAWTRANGLRKNYGLSVEEYEAMWAAQGFKCGACGTTKTTQSRGWHVDHDHETNEIRAILCRSCNITLGNAQDNPHRLRLLADYIERHKNARHAC